MLMAIGNALKHRMLSRPTRVLFEHLPPETDIGA
jgi:hypothetical protein